MVININVPNIGEDVLEVTEILIKVGDHVYINQPILIIEGDKSSMEIPTPYSGIITEIHTRIGDTVQTGSLILSLDTNNNEHTNITNKKTTSQNTIPQIHNLNNQNKKNDNNTYHTNAIPNNNKFLIHATPLIRQIAREFEIDLSKIQGSGRKGRILKEDIQNYLNTSKNQTNYHILKKISPKISDTLTFKQSEINYNKFGNTKTIPLNKIQKITGSNLKKNWIEIPHVTQFDTVDITDLENFRKKQNIEIKRKKMNYKITILVFVIKAVSKALKEFTNFNSSLSKDGLTLILKKYINIGIAVDTNNGLVVPVIKNVDKKNITTLSKELLEISQKARQKHQLTPFDIQGGTFTISNLGGIGGTAFTPIINAPEVAILGISKSTMQPTWNGKKFTPRLILPISLSYDHRVINGVDGIKFINFISKIISDIRLLSM